LLVLACGVFMLAPSKWMRPPEWHRSQGVVSSLAGWRVMKPGHCDGAGRGGLISQSLRLLDHAAHRVMSCPVSGAFEDSSSLSSSAMAGSSMATVSGLGKRFGQQSPGGWWQRYNRPFGGDARLLSAGPGRVWLRLVMAMVTCPSGLRHGDTRLPCGCGRCGSSTRFVFRPVDTDRRAALPLLPSFVVSSHEKHTRGVVSRLTPSAFCFCWAGMGRVWLWVYLPLGTPPSTVGVE